MVFNSSISSTTIGGVYSLSSPEASRRLQDYTCSDILMALRDGASQQTPASDGSTMKAVRFHGKEDIRLERIPVPVCADGQIKIKPAWCGICGRVRGPSLCPTTPHPITGETVPLTFGHEFSGTIEEIGHGVSDRWAVGQKVCVQPIIYDGSCGSCKLGLINCCDSNGFVGLSGWGGGLSEHIIVPEYAVIAVPENVGLDIAALVEPLAVGWHAVKASPYKSGDAVLILGGGPIGLAVIQALKARGCERIIVSEPSKIRKQHAKEFGAHFVLDPTSEDIVARCRELSNNQGVDVAFDAAGVQPALTQAFRALRAKGTLVNIAIWEKPAYLMMNDLVFRERNYMGVATYVKGDFDEVLEAISSGRMQNLESMITKRIGLDEVVEGGFRALIEEKDKHVKILVRAGDEP